MSQVKKRVLRWANASRANVRDELAVEEPLEIRVDSRPLVVTMRTPGNDDELAAGFLVTEGLIKSRSQLCGVRKNLRNRSGNCLDVFLAPNVSVNFEQLTRRVFSSSSCGLCGKETLRSVRQRFKPVHSRLAVNADLLTQLPGKLRIAQPTFERTGGLHAAGLFTREGDLVIAREDIGRHNAVDKIVGFGLLNDRLPFEEHILLVSGRASFEIMQKSLAARIPIVCAISAPSSLAVEFARANNQTLIGFLREQRLNVYTGRQRVHFR